MDDKMLLEAIRAIVKQETDALKTDISAIKADIATHNHETVPKLQTVSEGVMSLVERAERLDTVEETVEEHGHRIWALEQAVKTQ